MVIKTTCELLENEKELNLIIDAIYKKHQNINKESEVIKSLEKKRTDALKASNNLISAIEQGIITEQTKIRLKELESQISQLDFDIEQAKQRNYSYLTPAKIKEYFDKVICGDTRTDETRKHIIKYFIREVVLYNDKITITFNFTEKEIMKKTTPDDINEIENEIKLTEKSVLTNKECSYKKTNSPPIGTAFAHAVLLFLSKRYSCNYYSYNKVCA